MGTVLGRGSPLPLPLPLPRDDASDRQEGTQLERPLLRDRR